VRVIPVLDLLNGVVVRGVAGRRESYRPIESRLTADVSALAIARAFRSQFDLDVLYLADLDAIGHGRPNLEVYRLLSNDGFQLLIDAGCGEPAAAQAVLNAGAARVIVGLESCPGPEALWRVCDTIGPGRVVFSLDLKDGRPLVVPGTWQRHAPLEIAQKALAARVDALIVLDLAQVGVGRGVQTADLCGEIRRGTPEVRLITGGGVRGRGDLQTQAELGVTGLLVASALHDGRLTPADLDGFRAGWPVGNGSVSADDRLSATGSCETSVSDSMGRVDKRILPP